MEKFGTEGSRVRRVKEQLFPLSPFAKFLEFLVELLPRKLIDVFLEPLKDTISILGDGAYRTVDEFPKFSVRMDPPCQRGGWFYLELSLIRHTGNREAIISGLRRNNIGGTEEFVIPVPSNLRGSVREVLMIPSDVESLFWIPMLANGYFSQSELILHRITWLEAGLRRTHRVLLTIYHQRNLSVGSKDGLTLKLAMGDLQNAYLRTARLQIRSYRSLDYAGFISRIESRTVPKEFSHSQIAPNLNWPLFHIILDLTGKFDLKLADLTLRSLRAQNYSFWTATILVADSTTEVWPILARHTTEDSRFSLESIVASTLSLAPNISSTFNKYVLHLNAGEYPSANSLRHIAQAIIADPGIKLIYTDHDTIDFNGIRSNPQFKPDWNPDYFLSYDYLGGFFCIAPQTYSDVGGYPWKVDARLRRYALALRVSLSTRGRGIAHVPQVLFHCQPPSQDDVPEVADSIALVANFLSDSNIEVTPGLLPGTHRLRYPIPNPIPLVTIVVPTRDRLDILKPCIESVLSLTDYPNFEILIVDNGSIEPECVKWLDEITANMRIRVIRDNGPFNYSALNNRGVALAAGSILVLLNNDVEVISPEWLTEMIGLALRPEIGAVGAKLLYPNGMVQHAGVVLGIGGVAGHVHRYLDGDAAGYMHRAVVTQNVSAVTGACLAVRKDLYQQIGGLDEDNLHVAFNDVDFCIRLTREGYRNVFTPHALLYHHESLSRGHDDTPHKKAIFEREFAYMKRKWGPFADPAYNPNLTLEFGDFSLRRQ